MGNKWSLIARRIPGRTDNSIKNRFNSNLKRQLALGQVIPTYARTASILKQDDKKRVKKEESKLEAGQLEFHTEKSAPKL